MRSGYARGNLSFNGQTDFYRLTANAGDLLTVATEIPGNAGATQLFYQIYDTFGNRLTYFFPSYNGSGQSSPVALPYTGSYYVLVGTNYDYEGEYRVRVTLVPSATTQMETEPNDTTGNANTPTLSPVTINGKIHLSATLAGGILDGDPGDLYNLGNLTAGTAITLTETQPSNSGISDVLAVLDANGIAVATSTAGAGSLGYTIPNGGDGKYYARITTAGSGGLLNQYLLGIDLFDAVPPTITSASLPATTVAILSTGLDASNDLLTVSGSADANWTVDQSGGGTAPAQLVQPYSANFSSSWVPDGPNSAWIARNANLQNNGPAPYTFTRTFDLTGQNLANISIAGNWAVDDSGTLSLNGHQIATGSGGGSLSSFSVPAGSLFLNQGLNTLTITMTSNDQFVDAVRLEAVVSSTGQLSTTLPSDLVDRFSIGFSKDLNPATVNNTANYTLVNTTTNTTYQIASPGYTTGLGASFKITTGALQPGNYTFTIGTGITDKSGNSLAAPYVQNFTITGVAPYTQEQLGDSSFVTATAFGPTTSTFAGTFTAQPAMTTPASGSFSYVASADLNKDNKLDFVTANENSNTISVFLNQGNGTFTRTDYNVGSQPIGVAIADLDGDGKLDLAVANYISQTVSVLQGNGDGTFQPKVDFATGGNGNSVTIADLNNDNHPDIIAVNYNQGTVAVLKNLMTTPGTITTGSFAAAVTYAAGGNPVSVTTGLLNNDGNLDVAVSNYNQNTVGILLGNGDGTLQAVKTYGTGSGNAYNLVAVDLNGDNKLDLAVAVYNDSNHNLSVLTGNGDGTFNAATPYKVGSQYNCIEIATADLNGDNKPDLVLGAATNGFDVAYNNGDGTFTSFGYNTGTQSIGVALGDFNGDGRPDVITSSENNTATLFTGDSTITLSNDPAGSALRSGYARGNLSFNGQTDFYRLTANAGDLLTVATEIPGNAGATQLFYQIYDAFGNRLTYFYPSYNGSGQSSPVALPYTGSYYVLVGTNYDYEGEYRLRVTLVPSATTQMDSEPNDGINNANSPAFNAVAVNGSTHLKASIAGGILDGDGGDVYYLGNLLSGTVINLTETQPSTSGLSAFLAVLDPNGSVVAKSAAGAASFSYTLPIGASGRYYAQVTAASGVGLLGQYLLGIDMTSSAAPTVTSTTLPANQATSTAVIYSFSVNFSEDMAAALVNQPASYDLRSAGPDGAFGTADDLVYHVSNPSYSSGLTANFQITDGPLQPDIYQLTISGLTDRFGNPFAVPYVLTFKMVDVTGYTIEGRTSANPATPTVLTLTNDPSGSGMNLAGGRGALSNSNDNDYWTFNGTSGDQLSIVNENVGNPGGTSLHFIVTKPDGSSLANYNTDTNGHNKLAPLALPTSGTYTIHVLPNDNYFGEYRFRVVTVTPPLQYESGTNTTLANATPVTLTVNGDTSQGAIAGTTLFAGNNSYFKLGTIQSGQSILLTTLLPQSGALSPSVGIYDANGNYIAEAPGGRPFDGSAQVNISTTGTYYALMQANANGGSTLDQFIMNISVVPTSSLQSLPNLEVTSITLPSGSNIQSGQSITFSYTVENVGQAATDVPRWTDRAVLSMDQVYGNADDMTLVGAKDTFTHFGILNPGDSYTNNATVTLPDGINGNFYIIVQADNQFLVTEASTSRGDGISVSSTTFPVALAPYPDLIVSGLVQSGPNADGTYTVSWNTVNNGNGPVADAWQEHVVIRNQTTGATLLDSFQNFTGGIAANGGSALHMLPATGTFSIDAPGTIQVVVTTNSDQKLYEDNPLGHTNAVQNDTTAINFAATRDLTVTNVAVQSPANPQSGNLVTLNWKDTNTGNLTATGPWNDLVTVVNTTTSQTLYSATIPYNGAALAPNSASGTLSTQFTLPDGAAGVGNIQVSITVNTNTAVVEYNTAGTAKTNNTSTLNFSSTLAPYADLTIANGFPTVDASSVLQSGGTIVVDWKDKNIGTGAAGTAFTDLIALKNTTTGQSLSSQQVSGPSPLASGATSTQQQVTFTLPDGAAGVGNWLITVTTDNGQTVKEYDANGILAYGNNSATANTSTTLAPYADLTIAGTFPSIDASSVLQSGGKIVVDWKDQNIGNASASTAFTDLIALKNTTTNQSLPSQQVTGPSPLASGTTSTQQQVTFNLPDGAAGVGNWLITVTTDNGQTIKEYDSNGNLAYGNNSSTANTSTTLAPYADLSIANGFPNVDGSSVLQSGGKIVVDWKDQNTGTGAANVAFTDLIALKNTTTGQSLPSQQVSGPSPLASGATSTQQSVTFNLPDGSAGVGSWLITVTTDNGQTVKEYDANGNLAYGNNSATANTSTTLAAYANLTIAPNSLGFDPASNLQSGGSGAVVWKDENTGSAAVAGNFSDFVLVQHVNADNSLTTLASGFVAGPNGLAGNNGVSNQLSFPFTLPDGAAGAGNLKISVTTDYFQSIKEYDANGNQAYGDNSASATGTSALAHYADLVVTTGSIGTLPTSPQSGNSVTVNWTGTNQGNAAVNTAFADTVLVQRVNADNSLTFIASSPAIPGNATLAAGAASATQSWQFTLPNGTPGTGNFKITVTTDYASSVKEYDASGNPAYGNNASTATFSATLAPSPDLVVPANSIVVNGGSTNPVNPGQTIPVAWNDVNQGAVAAVGSWVDQVFLASDAAGTQNLQLVATVPVNGANLAATNGTMAQSATITIPVVDVGNKYIVILTGLSESFFEFNTGNNTTVSSSSITVPPSLLVSLATPGNRTFNKNQSNPASSATVTRNDTNVGNLSVTLTSSNAAAVLLSATPNGTPSRQISVTIPNGSYSATFYVFAVQDNVVDGTQTATITPAANGYNAITDTATELESNTPVLTLTPSANTFASNGSITATLTRNTNNASSNDTALTVNITSSDPQVATAPASVTIPANLSSVTFTITGVATNLLVAARSVTFTTNTPTDPVTGRPFAGGATTVTVTDSNTPTLVLTPDAPYVEQNANNPATNLTLQLTDGHGNPMPLPTAISVSLTSNDTFDLACRRSSAYRPTRPRYASP